MFGLIQSRNLLLAFVLTSEYSNSSFRESQLSIAEAFSYMGEGRNNHFVCPSDSVRFASENAELSKEEKILVVDHPPYKIAGMDLSASWIDLVRQNKVSASMSLQLVSGTREDSDEVDEDEENYESSTVEYGIKLVEKTNKTEDLDDVLDGLE